MLLRGKQILEILPLSDLYGEYAEHHRLRVFVQKGRDCVVCQRQGTLLIVTKDKRNKHGQEGGTHVDLYTDDFVLMTVDHIVPKAVCNRAGWSRSDRESINNKQPMCDPCNNGKGSNLMTNEELRKRRQSKNMQRNGKEVIRSLVPNIHRLLGDYDVEYGTTLQSTR